MPSRTSLRLRSIAAALGIAALGSVAVALLMPNAPAPQPPAAAPLATRVAESLAASQEVDLAKLVAKLAPHRTFDITSEIADRAVDAIKAGHEAIAARIMQDSLAATPAPSLLFKPYETLVRGMARPDDAALLDRLTAWAAREPQSPWPTIIRAQTYLDRAWLVRGDKFAALTRADHLRQFTDDMRLAEADITRSIAIDGHIAFSWFQLLTVLQGSGNTPAMETAFQAAIARFPNYYPLYRLRLLTLEPRWGGSIPLMYAFVAQYADKAEATSPLKILYLNLYSALLGQAARGCRQEDEENAPLCVAGAMGRIVTPDLETNLRVALSLHASLDRYGFDVALRRVLYEMLEARGGQAYLGAVLQLAADAQGSSNQLKQETPGHSSYLLDEVSASVWRDGGFWDNAETKYMQALQDLDAAPFADPETNAIVRAEIYDELAWAYKGSAQFEKLLAYRGAAIALAGDTDDDPRYLQCYAYWRLKQLDNASRVCTQELEATGDAPTRYWLSKVQSALGDKDSALHNLQILADSESGYRTAAAIDLSVIYGDRHDYQAMLSSLNSHGFLFQADAVSREDLAISFNNRCFALMQLQRYEEALADCSASLKFGNLPDAFQKEQELIKRLKTPQTPL